MDTNMECGISNWFANETCVKLPSGGDDDREDPNLKHGGGRGDAGGGNNDGGAAKAFPQVVKKENIIFRGLKSK